MIAEIEEKHRVVNHCQITTLCGERVATMDVLDRLSSRERVTERELTQKQLKPDCGNSQ